MAMHVKTHCTPIPAAATLGEAKGFILGRVPCIYREGGREYKFTPHGETYFSCEELARVQVGEYEIPAVMAAPAMFRKMEGLINMGQTWADCA